MNMDAQISFIAALRKLGLSEATRDPAEVEAAWRKIASQTHPDRNPNGKQEFIDAKAARDVVLKELEILAASRTKPPKVKVRVVRSSNSEFSDAEVERQVQQAIDDLQDHMDRENAPEPPPQPEPRRKRSFPRRPARPESAAAPTSSRNGAYPTLRISREQHHLATQLLGLAPNLHIPIPIQGTLEVSGHSFQGIFLVRLEKSAWINIGDERCILAID